MTAVCVCAARIVFYFGGFSHNSTKKNNVLPSAALERSVDFIIIVSLYIWLYTAHTNTKPNNEKNSKW